MALVLKKAMLPFTLQNSQGILCANVAGKVVAKVVRSQVVGPLATEAGARPRPGVAREASGGHGGHGPHCVGFRRRRR